MTRGFLLAWLLIVAMLAGLGATFLPQFAVRPAFPHQAPMGWSYDRSCCSGKDCHQIDDASVSEGAMGYTVTLTPDQHHQLMQPRTFFVEHGSERIRPSPDGRYHACITMEGEWFANGAVIGGYLVCLYVPPRAF